MKLINLEEHYTSKNILQKIQEILAKKRENGSVAVDNAIPCGTGLAESRLAYMDEHGIETQIVSCADALPATMEPQYAVPLCRALNDEMAELMKRYPGRFYIFAHLPLSSPREAATELERCVKELGFVGAMLSGHDRDLPYDDAHYFPVFEKAQELDVPVYLHPGVVRQDVIDAYYKGNWGLHTTSLLAGFGMGWHYDVGVQAVRMMAAGVFDKLPKLKIMLGHWGELVSFYMYRLDEMLDAGEKPKKKYSDYFKENIYVNPSGMLYAEQFRYCIETFGTDHILWGEDYPYRQKENIRTFLEEFDLSEEDREKIAHSNAEKLLHLAEKSHRNPADCKGRDAAMPYPYVEALANHPAPAPVPAVKIQTMRLPLMEQAAPITAKLMHRAFCENWSACNDQCFGYRQTVSGVVLWTGKDIHNKPSIQLSDAMDGNCYVHCVLISERGYDNVKVGDRITMQGNYLECHPKFGVVLKYSEIMENT